MKIVKYNFMQYKNGMKIVKRQLCEHAIADEGDFRTRIVNCSEVLLMVTKRSRTRRSTFCAFPSRRRTLIC